MRLCPVLRYDSFKSARKDLTPVFSSLKSPVSVRQALRRYISHVPRHLVNTQWQRGAWQRGNLNLLFDEARRRGSYIVARIALEVVLEQQLTMEPIWAKNALATCSNAAEIREMDSLLQQFHVHRSGGADGGVNGRLLPSTPEGDDALPPALIGDDDGGGIGEARNTSLLAAGLSASTLEVLHHQRDRVATAPNASFSRYFIRQGLVADEMELMDLFRSACGRQPVAFRVHTSQMYGKVVQGLLRDRPGINPITWMPPMCGAFIMQDTPETPHSVLLTNRQLLRALSNERLISFQSTSSMLPLLLLDPRPGEAVLDMCASPGSKTTLILDYISALSSSSFCWSGCTVANDAVSWRSRPLAERLQSFSPSIAVTQLQGQMFPVQPAAAGGVRYDKLLVDAPCTGEGRMRRDAASWRVWHPLKAMEFFPIQVALLRRALELCVVGGCVVYSTCTMNPLENEAVVSTVLADGGAELMRPPRSMIEGTGWNFSRGLRRWLVPSRAGGFLHTFAEAQAKGENVMAELFAPDGCERIQAALESCCLRVLPHLNGCAEGFFMVALRKSHHNPAIATPIPVHGGEKGITIADSNNNIFTSGSMLVSESILHARGVVRLAAGNSLLQRHLGVFFEDNVAQVEFFLAQNNLCVAWWEGQGLLLVSESTWAHLKAIPSSLSSSQLLELGVTVIDARTGHLTESGAFHLRPHATSRVLHLPLVEFQWLVSNQVLKISELQEDKTLLARRIVTNVGLSNHGVESTSRQTPLPWVAQVLATVGQREGNFIVCCISPSADGGGGGNADDVDGLASVCLPVTVQRSSVVELHLSLSHHSRQRCMAVFGRVIAHAKRASVAVVEKQGMQMGMQRSASSVMSSAALEGRSLTSERQLRRLFPPSLSSYSSSGVATAGHSSGSSSDDHGDSHQHQQRGGERYFEI